MWKFYIQSQYEQVSKPPQPAAAGKCGKRAQATRVGRRRLRGWQASFRGGERARVSPNRYKPLLQI